MKLGHQQSLAIDAMGRWFKTDDQVFYLGGYAGTGKTRLAIHFASMIGGDVRFITFTGKAALALRQRGAPDSSTIHQAIYEPVEKSRERLRQLKKELAKVQNNEPTDDGKTERELLQLIAEEKKRVTSPSFSLNPDSPLIGSKLVIVDECFMVEDSMFSDIMSFGIKILALGDPAQLQPVRGASWFAHRRPDALLTEIQRQDKDNPIIRLSMEVREGRNLPYGEWGTARKIKKADLTPDLLTDADQIITGKNTSRRRLNQYVRRHLLETPLLYPIKGEKLVCLRNDHDQGLLNGMLCRTTTDTIEDGEQLVFGVETDDGRRIDGIGAYPGHFWAYHQGEGAIDRDEARNLNEFDFGYALTVHKAQGSEWNSVVLCDDDFAYQQPETRRRWLYTGITRASRELLVVS